MIGKQLWGESECCIMICSMVTLAGLWLNYWFQLEELTSLSMNSISLPGSDATEIVCICWYQLELTLLSTNGISSPARRKSPIYFYALCMFLIVIKLKDVCLFSSAVFSPPKSMLKELETANVPLDSVMIECFCGSCLSAFSWGWGTKHTACACKVCSCALIWTIL